MGPPEVHSDKPGFNFDKSSDDDLVTDCCCGDCEALNRPDLADEGLSEGRQSVYQVLCIGGRIPTLPRWLRELMMMTDPIAILHPLDMCVHECGDQVPQGGVLHPNYSGTVASICIW